MAAALGILPSLGPGSPPPPMRPVDPRLVTDYQSELFLWNPHPQALEHDFRANGFVIDPVSRPKFLPKQWQVVRYVARGRECHKGALCYVNTQLVPPEFPPDDSRRSCTVIHFGAGEQADVKCVVRLPPRVYAVAVKLQEKIKKLDASAADTRGAFSASTIADQLLEIDNLLHDCDEAIMREQLAAARPAEKDRQLYPTKIMLFSAMGLRREIPYLTLPCFRILDLFKDDTPEQDLVRKRLFQIAMGDPESPVNRYLPSIGGKIVVPPLESARWT
eukprot:TRINITY_DN5531_c0_g1_i2.p2 TRINITY_DN5531_c0_g1~~TRINITY_DN5531_c0_g1_i2.p2  ORF type:complete len:303 (+),score=66.98 TRINITY_DN5531_c0_g1_i2:86-910(+)